MMLLLLATLPACTRSQPQYFVPPHLEASDTSFARTVEAHTLSPRVPGNGVTLLLNGDEIFPAMLSAIRSAPWASGALMAGCSRSGVFHSAAETRSGHSVVS